MMRARGDGPCVFAQLEAIEDHVPDWMSVLPASVIKNTISTLYPSDRKVPAPPASHTPPTLVPTGAARGRGAGLRGRGEAIVGTHDAGTARRGGGRQRRAPEAGYRGRAGSDTSLAESSDSQTGRSTRPEDGGHGCAAAAGAAAGAGAEACRGEEARGGESREINHAHSRRKCSRSPNTGGGGGRQGRVRA